MMKNIIYTLVVIIACAVGTTHGQIAWAKQSKENPSSRIGNGTAISHDIAVNPLGKSFITGTFTGFSSFDHIQFPEDPFNSLFVASYNREGDLDWAKHITGNQNNESYAIALDINDNVYIAGEYRQTNDHTILDFGNLQVEGNGSPSTYLAKANSKGEFLWATRILATPLPGQNHEAIISDIQVDDDGNIYMIGGVVDSVLIENKTYNTNNEARLSLFMAKFSTNGKLIWFKHSNLLEGQGPAFIIPGHMVLGSNGDLFINGEFGVFPPLGDLLGWDGSEIETILEKGQFLARFDTTGEMQWWQSMNTGSNHQFPNELGIDDEDNIYLTLQKTGHLNFSDGQINGNNIKGHVVLLKYNNHGDRQFIKEIAHGNVASSSDIWDGSLSLYTRPNGLCFMSGSYASISSDYIVFGNRDTFDMPIPSKDGPRQFIAAFDNNGEYIDVGFIIDKYPSKNDFPNVPGYYWDNTAISGNTEGELYITGKFAGDLGLHNKSLSTPEIGSAGGQAFSIKFDPNSILDLTAIHTSDFDYNLQEIEINPNPAQNWIKISMINISPNSIKNVQIFDLDGILILQKRFLENDLILDLNGIKKASYICKISTPSNHFSKKLIIN